MSYEAFIDNQAHIFRNIHNTHDEVGVSHGIENDPGTNPQGAFLIAWRYSDKISALVEELSLEVADLIPALTYGPENAHTTISDLDLSRGYIIDPNTHIAEKETLDTLCGAVHKTLNAVGREAIDNCTIEFTNNLTTGRSVVATGIPTEAVWRINQQVLSESEKSGIGLRGTWGTHMTMSRFLEDYDTESQSVTDLKQLLDDTPAIGPAKPTTIDVGYFYTTPTEGFVFTPYNRFDLDTY